MTTPAPTWIVMPIAGARAYTDAAIADCLAQSIPVRLLLIGQGLDDAYRQHLERVAEEHADRILLWSFDPMLPSLAAVWNRALEFVWEAGGEEALVVNNDVRLHRDTLRVLRRVSITQDTLFVSAVGVTPEQFDPTADLLRALHSDYAPVEIGERTQIAKGGPDFSCFLITKACHADYRFDEQFIPAFCEDLDYHRQLLLGGAGDRIFSINLPYLHFGSQTLKSLDTPQRLRIERQITEGSRAHYQKKWGGPVNAERFTIPFDPETAQDGVTTPELQRYTTAAGRVAAPNRIAETEV